MKRLVCPERNQVSWAEVEVGHPSAGQIQFKARYGAEKHGTMMAFYKGYGNDRGRWDTEWQMHRPEGVLWGYPVPLGNMQVGIVTAVGEGVDGWQVGDWGYYWGPFQPLANVSQAFPLREPARWKDALTMDPAEFAMGAVRDGNLRVGDAVAIFGMGAIGLMTVQMARLAGARPVVALDPLPHRREAALACGADFAWDPTQGDIGMQLRELTDKRGVDVVIDFSGSRHALQAGLRGVGYLGTIVCGAFPPPFDAGLDFGGEAHMNRPKLVFSRACSDPNPDHPRWDEARIWTTLAAMIDRGELRGDPVLGPFVAFEDLLDAYPRIAADPAAGVKLTVQYPE